MDVSERVSSARHFRSDLANDRFGSSFGRPDERRGPLCLLRKQTSQTSLAKSVSIGDIALAFLTTRRAPLRWLQANAPDNAGALKITIFLLSIRRLRQTGCSSSFEDSCALNGRESSSLLE
jgi:hypothetical protein